MEINAAGVILDHISTVIEEAIAPTMTLWRVKDPCPCDRNGLVFHERPDLNSDCTEQAEWKVALPITNADDEDEYGGTGTTVLCTTCLLSIINISNELLIDNEP